MEGNDENLKIKRSIHSNFKLSPDLVGPTFPPVPTGMTGTTGPTGVPEQPEAREQRE